jgi:uncharacterized protein YqjF (DUF2071 family)
MLPSNRVFLSAEWLDLVMLNYEVNLDLLREYVPRGTALDSFEGRTYLSLVGFRFLNTRLLGRVAIPFHASFDEINLRFYVRRTCGSEVRRGVVFIAEVVPRRAIATTAQLLYGENYRRFPMRHRIQTQGIDKKVEYEWRVGDEWCKLHARTSGHPVAPQDGSLEQFITEHYWGYSVLRNRRCLEYRVTHEPWRVWAVSEAGFEGDANILCGGELGAVLRRVPDSTFVADGSPVKVFKGDRVE